MLGLTNQKQSHFVFIKILFTNHAVGFFIIYIVSAIFTNCMGHGFPPPFDGL